MRKKIIAVIGGSSIDENTYQTAYLAGKIIAQKGHYLLCGGLAGVMEAAAQGAFEHGGTTLGILPGTDPTEANPYISIPIVTGMSTARNSIIARTCDIAVAINGKYGTLTEIAYCLDFGKKVYGYKTHLIEGIITLDKISELEKYL